MNTQGSPTQAKGAEQLTVTHGGGTWERSRDIMRAFDEQDSSTGPPSFPRRPIVLTFVRSSKHRPRRGKEDFPLSSDFTVLITLLPSSARGMSTNQNYLKDSKRNLAFRL